MLAVVCLLLNLLIAFYFAKNKWKGAYNLYLTFITLMGAMSLFYVSLPELQDTLKYYLGQEGYSTLKYIIVGNVPWGLSPMIAVELLSFLIGLIILVSIITDVIQSIAFFRYNKVPVIKKSVHRIIVQKKCETRKKIFALYCSYLC